MEVGEAKQAPSTGTNTQLVPKSTPSKNQTLCLCPFIQCQEHKCLWPPFPQDRGWGGGENQQLPTRFSVPEYHCRPHTPSSPFPSFLQP